MSPTHKKKMALPRSQKTNRPWDADTQAMMEGIGAQIRAARRHRKMTTTQLGELVGLSGPAISGMERGLYNIDAPRLRQFAQVLGIAFTIAAGGGTNGQAKSTARVDYATPDAVIDEQPFQQPGVT